MGTFSKSHGASGGYIAGPKETIARIRVMTNSLSYAESAHLPVLAQIIAAMSTVMGFADLPPSLQSSQAIPHQHPAPNFPPGLEYLGPLPAATLPSWMLKPSLIQDSTRSQTRIRRLTFNSRYLRLGLQKLGFDVLGDINSPIIPVLVYGPGTMAMMPRILRGRAIPIAIVIVTYPAVPIDRCRLRLCVSSSHTKSDMDEVLRAFVEAMQIIGFSSTPKNQQMSLEEVIEGAVELVASV